MDARALETLLAVTLVAALAPVIVAALPGPKVPQVVVLILAGVLIGPQGLGLGDTASVRLLANIGLGFLFLLAGYELDPRLFRERSGRLAMVGWAASALLAVAAVGVLAKLNLVRDFVPIGLALTTTALGTLLPILHDNDMLEGRFGRYILAAGAVGELFPIVAISLFLTKRNQFVALGSLLAVGAAALLLTTAPRIIGKRRLNALIQQGQRATAQSTLRWSIVLLVLLLVAAEKFGDDVVLGAMLAGMVLRSWTRRMDMEVDHLEDKLDAVGYGIFIPVFFVSSGMTLDVHSILANPARLFIFLGLAAAGARPAVAAGVPEGAAAAAAAGDDVHHGNHDAAAHRAGGDRAQRRRDAALKRRRAGRRRGAVRAHLPGDRGRDAPARSPGPARHGRPDTERNWPERNGRGTARTRQRRARPRHRGVPLAALLEERGQRAQAPQRVQVQVFRGHVDAVALADLPQQPGAGQRVQAGLAAEQRRVRGQVG